MPNGIHDFGGLGVYRRWKARNMSCDHLFTTRGLESLLRSTGACIYRFVAKAFMSSSSYSSIRLQNRKEEMIDRGKPVVS